MPKKLQAKRLALSIAVFSGLLMLVLWLLANAGIYVSATEQMAKWHMFFDLSVGGLIAGIIEAVNWFQNSTYVNLDFFEGFVLLY